MVLLAAQLRAVANVNTIAGTPSYAGVDLLTPVDRVSLRPHVALTVTVQTINNSIAVVRRIPGATGPLRYEQWSDCGVEGARALTWTTAATGYVDAGCPQPREWHVVAGWLDYPVAFVNIISPATSIVLTPPFSAAPYTVHVRDMIEVRVLLLGPGEDVANADPAYLHLKSASAVGAEPVRYDWRWLAVTPGSTQIIINRRYPSGRQYVIRLHILR